MKLPNYHENLEIFHLNCEKPHSYFIPYHDAAAAKADDRASSAFFKSLCGDWDFKWYPCPADVCDFTSPDFDRSNMDKLAVPMNWQVALGRGYDVPNYTDSAYPSHTTVLTCRMTIPADFISAISTSPKHKLTAKRYF